MTNSTERALIHATDIWEYEEPTNTRYELTGGAAYDFSKSSYTSEVTDEEELLVEDTKVVIRVI